ncbi:MAG: hypothetical protein ACSLE1_11705 [Sphingobium sp.]
MAKGAPFAGAVWSFLMKIELKNVHYSAALSQETAAYAAEIWIDGELAFHARNEGTGGADFYHRIGRWTEAEVDAWLKANRPPRALDDFTCDHDLELEVNDLLARVVEGRRLKRLLRTNLITIEKSQILHYPLRKRPLAIVARAVRATNPEAVIVNDAGEDVLSRALDLLLTGR